MARARLEEEEKKKKWMVLWIADRCLYGPFASRIDRKTGRDGI
jgi:hypothetical protein